MRCHRRPRRPEPRHRVRSNVLRAGVTAVGLAAALAVSLPGIASALPTPSSATFIGPLHDQSTVASTIPHNGDLNPYGVAVVPHTTGQLVAGDVLVSNFNASDNSQGTGSTIMEISPRGMTRTFAHLNPNSFAGGVGLTTALAVFNNGFVVVGSLPTDDGTITPQSQGALIVLNSAGHVVSTIANAQINGPWDLATQDLGPFGVLYVTNVLNGTLAHSPATVDQGTVVRIVLDFAGPAPQVLGQTVIGSGFPERTDPNALVVGPTGVALSPNGTLYVADSVNNRITAIAKATTRPGSAGVGQVVTSGGFLNTPLGLTLAPNGDILSVNAADGNIVETTPSGVQVAHRLLDNNASPGPDPGAGSLFGLALTPDNRSVYFVDDDNNNLNLLTR